MNVITEYKVKKIIEKLLKGEDYRIEIVAMINAQFLQFAIGFFKRVVEAKLINHNITPDWYKKEFIENIELSKEDIAINSGLNMKTINNMYNSTARQIVIDASEAHYGSLYNSIQELVAVEHEIEMTLTIKFRAVSVDLNVSETLIIINTLAVKRAALRGGLWSAVGKRVEKPLMLVLCKLYNVDANYFKIKLHDISVNNLNFEFEREIDFYLCSQGIDHKCEVKLMGKGNPESADAVIARDSKVFIADKLSATNKAQLDSLDILWLELRRDNGFKKFANILESLKIPYRECRQDLDTIFSEVFLDPRFDIGI